jgi:hypothetical protein
LLAGLVRHACGGRMSGHTPKTTWYYRCARNETFQAPLDASGCPVRCSAKPVNGARIEAAIWDTLTGLLQQPGLLIAELERLREPDSTTHTILTTERLHLEQRLKALPSEEQRLVEGYRRGLFDDVHLAREMSNVQAERRAAAERLQEVQRQLALHERAAELRTGVIAFAEQVTAGLARMDFGQKQELLRLLVDEVTYQDDGTVTIKTVLPIGQLHPVAGGPG